MIMTTRSSRFFKLASAFFLSAMLAACSSTPKPETSAIYMRLDQSGSTIDSTAALSMINAYRQSKRLAPLTEDAGLSSEAVTIASTAAHDDKSSFGEMPDMAQGATGTSRIVRVSAGYYTVAEAFSGWRGVPQHDAAMLAPNATRLGIGTALAANAKYKVYWALIVE
jgi:uncharacterized protein YkwD